MQYPQPPIVWRGCHPNNYTVGREGNRIRYITFHHAVGSLESVAQAWSNPNRGGSSHFGVGSQIHQYVSIDNTAWTDGNWSSNLQSITIEHAGDWRFGYRDEATIENSANLVAWLIATYDPAYRRHREVSLKPTECPGDLPVEEIWSRAIAKLRAFEASQNPEWLKNRVDIANVQMYAQIDGIRIYDLNNPANPADSRSWARNNDFLIGGETTVGGVKYFITESSMSLNKANGLRASELSTTPWTPPQPPADNRPEWQKNLVDTPNRVMWVQYDTFLIDLVKGVPVRDANGNEVRYSVGTKLEDISAQTVIGGKSYWLTEYSFSKGIGRGFLANALVTTDPTPPVVTPPVEPPKPPVVTPPVEEYPNWFVSFIKKIIEAIINIIPGVNKK